MTAYIATLFEAPFPDTETLGNPLFSLIQNTRAHEIRPILKKYGLESIEADKWYTMQRVLDAIKEITESNDYANEDLASVGIKTVETALMPPDINSIETALSFIDRLNKTLNRHIPAECGIRPDPVEVGWTQQLDNSDLQTRLK